MAETKQKREKRVKGAVARRIRQYAKERPQRGSRAAIDALAEDTGIPAQTISGYDDDKLPSGPTLQKFAADGMNIHWLLTGTGDVFAPLPSVEDVLDDPTLEIEEDTEVILMGGYAEETILPPADDRRTLLDKLERHALAAEHHAVASIAIARELRALE